MEAMVDVSHAIAGLNAALDHKQLVLPPPHGSASVRILLFLDLELSVQTIVEAERSSRVIVKQSRSQGPQSGKNT